MERSAFWNRLQDAEDAHRRDQQQRQEDEERKRRKASTGNGHTEWPGDDSSGHPEAEPKAEAKPDGHDKDSGNQSRHERIKATIVRLAALDDITYQMVREDEAKALNIKPTSFLDKKIREARAAAADAPPYDSVQTEFYAVMPEHKYLFVPTRALWPSASVNGRYGEDTSQWLDSHRAVEALTWAPGEPLIIEDRLICDGDWIDRPDSRTINLYRPPSIGPGNPDKAGRWLKHACKIYPDGFKHLVAYLAHRVQHPSEKINHAVVLGGVPGIGKDTILEPVKHAVGPWNFAEVAPRQVMGRFNGFLKSVIIRISEARDLGEFDRFAFYETMKPYLAAPPDMLRVDEKNLREYNVPNVLAAIITTNHRTDALYLPPDDRRHYCLWSNAKKEDFSEDYWNELWGWYANGGLEHVAAYLRRYDLSRFDPKKPPEKTTAFWAICDNARAPEEAELWDELEKLGWPDAITLDEVILAAKGGIVAWLEDRKNMRAIPHKFELCGYVSLRNSGTADGRWKVGGKNKMIYVRSKLSTAAQHEAVAKLIKRRSSP